MECKKVKFSNLSWSLKTAVIMSWIVGVFFAITFLVGMIQEIMLV